MITSNYIIVIYNNYIFEERENMYVNILNVCEFNSLIAFNL